MAWKGTLKEKEDRAKKHTMMRTQQPAQKKVTVRHWSVKDESNASWSICMYTYLRNIGPLFFMEFSFSQKFESLIVSFDGSFCSCLLKSYLVILTSERDHHTCLPTNLYLKGCQLHTISHVFSEEESWSQTYVFWWIASQFDHVSKCSIWVFLGDEAIWKKIWLFTRSWFHGEFLEFQSYSKQKSFCCLFKTNLFWKIQAILMDRFAWVLKNFCFPFGDVKWWVQDLVWGFQRTGFQSIHFGCMNNDLFCMGKQSLLIQIACLWLEMAWLGT